MNHQKSFADVQHETKRKKTRREVFLDEMGAFSWEAYGTSHTPFRLTRIAHWSRFLQRANRHQCDEDGYQMPDSSSLSVINVDLKAELIAHRR